LCCVQVSQHSHQQALSDLNLEWEKRLAAQQDDFRSKISNLERLHAEENEKLQGRWEEDKKVDLRHVQLCVRCLLN